MKKISALLMAVLLLAGIAACGARDVTQAVQTAAELAEALNELQSAPDQGAAPAEPPAEAATAAEAPAEAAQPEELPAEEPEAEEPAEAGTAPDPDGAYTTKEDVAAYLHAYGELPGNFITKNEARALGWSGGGLDGYADGKSIGGDRFGNYEGLLPEAPGREYRECDIDTMHASGRGAKRIVYSNDGLIYYTDDHYESFTLLYPEE